MTPEPHQLRTLWDDQAVPGQAEVIQVVHDMADSYRRTRNQHPLPALWVGDAVYRHLTDHQDAYEAEAMRVFGYVPELHPASEPVPWPPTEQPQLCTWCTNLTLRAARDVCEAERCPFATDTYLRNPQPPSADGSMCTFPGCDCAGDEPVCEDYLTTNGTRRLMRLAGGERCPVHDLPEPCPTCTAVVGLPL